MVCDNRQVPCLSYKPKQPHIKVTDYYFDIEVYSKGKRPDPEKDKIITIQFQRINLKKGLPLGELKILKEWESSEELIVKAFYKRFFEHQKSVWEFVPVGNNLNFEFEFLKEKFNQFCGTHLTSKDLHFNIPHFDIKPILLTLNNGEFKGSGLHNFTGKKTSGHVIREYYEKKQFDKIEEYITEETEEFLKFLQKVMENSGKWFKDVVKI